MQKSPLTTAQALYNPNMQIAPRASWHNFPDAVLHAQETAIKHDTVYAAAKSGDADAASDLVRRSVNFQALQKIAQLAAGRSVTFASVHAEEASGRNAIPEALAVGLAEALGGTVDREIVQTNVVAHRGRWFHPSGASGNVCRRH